MVSVIRTPRVAEASTTIGDLAIIAGEIEWIESDIGLMCAG
jgi:hypothetical protein